VGGRRPDDDRDLPRGDPTHAVPQHRPLDAVACPGGAIERREHVEGRGEMDLVVEREDAPATRTVGAHAPGEQYDAAEARGLELPGRGRER